MYLFLSVYALMKVFCAPQERFGEALSEEESLKKISAKKYEISSSYDIHEISESGENFENAMLPSVFYDFDTRMCAKIQGDEKNTSAIVKSQACRRADKKCGGVKAKVAKRGNVKKQTKRNGRNHGNDFIIECNSCESRSVCSDIDWRCMKLNDLCTIGATTPTSNYECEKMKDMIMGFIAILCQNKCDTSNFATELSTLLRTIAAVSVKQSVLTTSISDTSTLLDTALRNILEFYTTISSGSYPPMSEMFFNSLLCEVKSAICAAKSQLMSNLIKAILDYPQPTLLSAKNVVRVENLAEKPARSPEFQLMFNQLKESFIQK